MKNTRFTILFITVVLMATSGLWTQQWGKGRGSGKQNRGNQDMFINLLNQIPKQSIDQAESDGLVLMAEEEKLARDVYLKLAEQWDLPIFGNIAKSEDRHMRAVLTFIIKYELPSPIQSDDPGVFATQKFSDLYAELVRLGSGSLLDALVVGATVEDMDIADLQNLLIQTDNEDIKILYQNLMKGSRNHLRSFYSRIQQNGGSYEPRYISGDEFQAIISSPMERGFYNNNGGHYYGNQDW